MLKETIDRMRFDMDEMRNNAASASSAAGGGPGSAAGSMSKSLGAELLGKMGDGEWDEVKARGRIELEEETGSESEVTVVETASDGEETEGEDVVQTIITRKKRVRIFALVPSEMQLTTDASAEGAWARERDNRVVRGVERVLGCVDAARDRGVLVEHANTDGAGAHYPHREL